MLRGVISGALILFTLGACTTFPRANPAAEAKLVEANAALDALSADINVFYEYLAALLEDIKTLTEPPGWYDMEVLIATLESASLGEGESPLQRGYEDGIAEWTAQWGDAAEELLAQYQSLADRCSISEARRIGLIGRLVAMQAWYLEITFLELSANRQAQAEAAYSTVQALSRTQDELDSYVLDAMGLYEAATHH